MSEEREMSCAELAEVAAELALGVLTGRERAEAIAHLDRCEACREDVRQLMATGEELLGLLPAIEPPAGFETRVLGRLGLASAGPRPPAGEPRTAGREPRPSGRERRQGRRESRGAWRGPWSQRPGPAPVTRPAGASRGRRLLAAAAVALAVIGAGVGGWGLGVGTAARPAAPPAASGWAPLSSAAFLTASHQNVGQLFLYQGTPRWLYMSVELPSGDGMVTCQVVGTDGTVHTVGAFRLAGGYGAWGSPDSGTVGQVRGARLVAANGTVLATATFS